MFTYLKTNQVIFLFAFFVPDPSITQFQFQVCLSRKSVQFTQELFAFVTART